MPGSSPGMTVKCVRSVDVSDVSLEFDLAGIDRVGRGGGADIGFDAVAVHDVHGAVKQARDVFLEAGVVEYGEMRFRIDFDHDVDIAVTTAVAPRHPAQYSRPPHAARAQIGFGSTQGFEGFAAVHEAEH